MITFITLLNLKSPGIRKLTRRKAHTNFNLYLNLNTQEAQLESERVDRTKQI